MNINSRTSKVNFIRYTAGAIASFTGLRGARCKVKVNAIDVSECNVVVCGANVWDEETELGVLDTTTGADAFSTSTLRSKNYISVAPDTTYYFCNPSMSQLNVWACFYTESKTIITGVVTGKSQYNNACRIDSTTFTTPSNCAYIRFYCTPAYGTTYNHDIAINYPSTDTSYHSYNENMYTIPTNEFTQIEQRIGVNNIFVNDENVDDGTVEVYYVTI